MLELFKRIVCRIPSSKKTTVVQSLSCVWLFVTPWTVAHQASLSFTISQFIFENWNCNGISKKRKKEIIIWDVQENIAVFKDPPTANQVSKIEKKKKFKGIHIFTMPYLDSMELFFYSVLFVNQKAFHSRHPWGA